MAYKTNREKVVEFVDKVIIEGLKEKDLDYSLVLEGVSTETGVSRNIVEDILSSYIRSGKIKEVRILTIPDCEIPNFIQLLKKKDQEKKQIEEEAEKILGIK